MLFPFRISLTAKNNKQELEAIPRLEVTNGCVYTDFVSMAQHNRTRTVPSNMCLRDLNSAHQRVMTTRDGNVWEPYTKSENCDKQQCY